MLALLHLEHGARAVSGFTRKAALSETLQNQAHVSHQVSLRIPSHLEKPCNFLRQCHGAHDHMTGSKM